MSPDQIRERLQIAPDRLEAINAILLDPDMQVIDDFLGVVAKYGTPEEIINHEDVRRVYLGDSFR